ncbi:MAG: protein-L-isoaspartate O-methyltransferase [Gammaproteobacteria bacterium]|nr:MAG: protein-L-isoaspartate O-methyltransferase [Gammaproteobacteria bacterium]
MSTTAEVARFNMIEQQLRPWEVLDRQVLAVINKIDRQDFVPEQYRGLAYADCQIPIATNISMLPPTIEGRMLQSLLIGADDNILEIGSGSGFIGACLASLGGQVHSLDADAGVQDQARKNTTACEISNIEYEQANAFESNYDQAFDVIAVTGSVRAVPENLKQALKIGGRMFIIAGQSPAMQALLITRAGDTEWNTQSLFETDIPALII